MALQNKVREKLAEAFIAALSEGKLPWIACWRSGQPENAVTGKRYRGVNSAILSYYADDRGYTDSRWCTYNQAQKKGWQVRKGSEGCPVEYWAYYDTKQKKLLSWPDANQLLKDKEYADKYLVLRSRTFIVFNAAQIDGIPAQQLQAQTNIDAIRQQRDTLLRNMALSYQEQGSRAYYSPGLDMVTLPPESTFFDTYSYACTFLHECGHATGHPSRLNRDLSGGFGSESYAREELRAEIASAFTAQTIGLRLTDEQLQPHMDRHKAYIQAWAAVLMDAPEELFRAIKDAEKISDYLLEKGEFEITPELAPEEKAVAVKSQPVEKAAPKSLESLIADIKATPQKAAPCPAVGRIDYLSNKGTVAYSAEFLDEQEFLKEIKDCNHTGVPMSIVLYQGKDGKNIPTDFIASLDPPPLGIQTVDSPYLPSSPAKIPELER